VLPDLLSTLLDLVHPGEPDAATVTATLEAARDEAMAKGEALVVHLVGQSEEARVVAVERHLP